ncbi:hypothetical protein IU452_01130 [Nocardia transvalensis]|nr:hypothetical protein [Nocardia transvalensis]MBF6327113.1 hypothetical protein [Nocardia transvalensis]
MCAVGVLATGFSTVGVAAAESVTVPFQIHPAPYGNPNGSFDVPPLRCAAVVGEQPGVALITGGKAGRWGCPLSSHVQWLNLSTGTTGSTQLSDGLHGRPAEATLNTGAGQVVVMLNTLGPTTTPGFAWFHVP